MSDESREAQNTELPKELVKRAELMMDVGQYLNNVKSLLSNDEFDAILDAELKAISQLCEICGGAMCGEYCPALRYTIEINQLIGDKKCKTGQ